MSEIRAGIGRIGDFVVRWGESLRWDDLHERLYFVDCAERTLHWLEGGEPPLHTVQLGTLPTGLVLTAYMIADVQTASPTVGVLSVHACRKPADSDRNDWARRPGVRMRRTHHAWRVASCVRGVPDSMHDAGLCAPERGRTMAGWDPSAYRSR